MLTGYQQKLHDAAAPGRRAVVEHFDEIIERIEAGESVRQICASLRLDRNHFKRVVRDDSALRQRYQAARAKWSEPHARSRLHFGAIERRILNGEVFLEIFKAGAPVGFPDGKSFQKFLNSSPEHAARYRAALRAREAGPNARAGTALRYTDAEIVEAAAALAASPIRYVSVNRVAPNGPHIKTLLKARHRNPELCAVIEGAMITRINRLKIVDGPMFKPLTPGLVLPQRKAVARVYEKHVLKRSLHQNDLYSAVEAAVPRSFQSFDREDIVAESIAQMLEDGLDIDAVDTVIRDVIHEFYENTKRRPFELDKSIGNDSTLRHVDTITTGW